MANKKKAAKAADEGFLTTAAQAIGSTLGQLAVKAGVVAATPLASKKSAAKKAVAVIKKKTVAKRNPAVSKKKSPVKGK